MELAQCDMYELLKHYKNSFIPHSVLRAGLKELVEALVYLHENDITHNDIKLENIFCFMD